MSPAAQVTLSAAGDAGIPRTIELYAEHQLSTARGE